VAQRWNGNNEHPPNKQQQIDVVPDKNAEVVLVNVIPSELSAEQNADSEPFLAIDPRDSRNMAISAFTPVIGLMDDLFVLAVGMACLRVLTPREVLREARWHVQNQLNRGENFLPTAVRTITVVVAVIWLVFTGCVFLVVIRHNGRIP
jgi:hypothetical protein